ncbi:O-methyltransferase [uncultured Maribacter sp.]|uniref:O-methyltransferase n=1 Tax=uncultured Maribacter sp. TaxID=431308 RepID=UPI0026373DA1|nr:O-methyltransferase [uncultured Maribacter sp.]
MNSPKYLNYEVRPFKFTERKMMLASLQRICSYFGSDYQYIGLGGLSFADFKLFHKELHIDDMISIEGGSFSQEKLEFNSPYSFIEILKERTTTALNRIDLNKKTLIWLDYDGVLDNYFFDDITTLFSKLPEGSIYIVTCNKELKVDETRKEYDKEKFKEKFGSLVPFDINNKDFSSANNHKTIRKMISNHITKILKNRSEVDIDLKFIQLFNLIYQEYRGANMYTFGGIIASKDFDISSLSLNDFDFLSDDESSYKIEIPNLTRKEVELVNSKVHKKEEDLIEMNIISESDLRKYKKSYKYIPHFYDVRV